MIGSPARSRPVQTARMRTYLWDFSDGHGEGTARQFLLHLRDFLRDHDLGDCESGVVKTGPGAFAAWCTVADSARSIIETQLKPSRSSDGGPR